MIDVGKSTTINNLIAQLMASQIYVIHCLRQRPDTPSSLVSFRRTHYTLTWAPAYDVLELITTFTIFPYLPKYSCRFSTSVLDSLSDKPTANTRFFCTTLQRKTIDWINIERFVVLTSGTQWYNPQLLKVRVGITFRSRSERVPDVSQMPPILCSLLLSSHIFLPSFFLDLC